jgi:uncharacterized protein
MTTHALTVENEQLVLLPERAIFWPAQSMLLIADMHCGKAATFRARHVPIPEGGTDADLARLSTLLHSTQATHLAILGDWIHAEVGCTPAVMNAVQAWRQRHPALDIHWVRGNHDRLAPALRAQFAFQESDFLDLGPFRLQHHPGETPGRYTLAGHLHPKAVLKAPGFPRLHVPCFHFTATGAVLPAFGSFTGGHPVQPTPTSRLYVIADSTVLAWSPARSGRQTLNP